METQILDNNQKLEIDGRKFGSIIEAIDNAIENSKTDKIGGVVINVSTEYYHYIRRKLRRLNKEKMGAIINKLKI